MSNLYKTMCEFCDEYCKMPQEYLSRFKDTDEANERMSIEECETCPLVNAYVNIDEKLQDRLQENYHIAVMRKDIIKPKAWALYQTWKWYDEHEETRKGSEFDG